MEKYKHFGQKTLRGIMSVVIFFLIADVIVFLLMFFKVDLNSVFSKQTENTVFNNLQINTDNTIKPTLSKITDNIDK